jgi:hypothetical protein
MCDSTQVLKTEDMQHLTNSTFWQNFWPDSTFWKNFWPNFAADLIVGIIIAGLVSWLLKKLQKVEAQMRIRWKLASDEQLLLCFSVWNTGAINFRSEEIYWHILIEENFQSDSTQWGIVVKDRAEINGRYFVHYKDILKSPVFPSRYTDCFAVVIPEYKKVEKGNVRYFLSTAHGIFPRTTKIKKDGDIDLTTTESIQTGNT